MSLSFMASRLLWSLLLLIGGLQLASAERTTTYFHTDGLGSVVAASNESGALLWRKSYAPYGEQIDAQPDDERLSYTGKPHDDATGLTYFGGRYYDPSIGRFTSVDPVHFIESNPMSFNRYAYANNNPYKYVDPDGEFVNFAAKFVLDVGVNIAFNYVTTGQLDVGGALKESAVGILNPAKTVAKLGKLANAVAKAEKKTHGITSGASKLTGDGDRVIYRMGTSKESASRLGRKAQEAEDAIGIHGVSGSTTKPSVPCSAASCSSLETAGFKVRATPTRNDPNHVTIELPNPVTKEVAKKFNDAFGRRDVR